MISPQAIIATIKVNLQRWPLWSSETAQECLGLERKELMGMIDTGEISWAFNIGLSTHSSKEIRILSHCIIERASGPIPAIGATRNLKLPEVISLILPGRDIRSTELCRLFSCSHQHVYKIAPRLKVVAKPPVKDGPNSFTVFSRVSVAGFLEKRRIL